jgi:hypothetical protein
MKRRLVPLYPIVLAAVLVAATAARADLHVIESGVAAIKVGSQLADRDSITIPAGAQIRVVLPSGKTQTVRGPFTGTVADLAGGQPRNEGVLTWLKDFLKTGGATEATPGATRSIGREVPKPRLAFSWSAVPVTMDGSVCIDKGARLELVRAPSLPAERVAVIDAASSERGEAQWEAGSDRAAWPAGTYHFIVGDRPPRRITLRVLPNLPADDDVLTELHRLGCKQQFEAWVREKVASGKR